MDLTVSLHGNFIYVNIIGIVYIDLAEILVPLKTTVMNFEVKQSINLDQFSRLMSVLTIKEKFEMIMSYCQVINANFQVFFQSLYFNWCIKIYMISQQSDRQKHHIDLRIILLSLIYHSIISDGTILQIRTIIVFEKL